MALTILAGLWSRPSSSGLDRDKETNLRELRKALKLHKKAMESAKIPGVGLRGLFVAPEYYFAQPFSGSWDMTRGRFRTRAIAQTDKEHIVRQLQTISDDFPGVIILPGTIAWRKPLDRVGEYRYERDKSTGMRTDQLKTDDRRSKAFQKIASEGNSNMATVGYFSVAFQEAVRQAIEEDFLDFGTRRGNRVAKHGISEHDAFVKLIYKAMRKPEFQQKIIQKYNLPPDAVHFIPQVLQKMALQFDATFMMRNTAYLLYDGKIRFKYNKRADFHESIGDDWDTVYVPGDKLGLTEPIEGLTIGMEICMDHANMVLNSGFPEGKQNPNIHIVVSDTVTTRYARARNYFVHASTNQNATAVWRPGSPTLETPEAHTDSVAGGNIRYWKLTIDG
jgi:predicted amidohydrolase